MLPHGVFFLVNLVVFLLVVAVDRHRARDYLYLSGLALVLALAFENVTIAAGFWYYHSEPKVGLLSLYTWLLYVPYLGYCYFLSNKAVKYV